MTNFELAMKRLSDAYQAMTDAGMRRELHVRAREQARAGLEQADRDVLTARENFRQARAALEDELKKLKAE